MLLPFLLLVVVVGSISGEGTDEKRSTQLWRVNSVPNTSDRTTLLHDFEPYYHFFGEESLSASTKHSTSPALTVHYRKGSYTGDRYMRGAGFYTTPPEIPDKAEKLNLEYEVFFENFGFGNAGKLPGLFGGEKGDGAYLCSGGHNPSSCFTLRLMWRQNGQGEIYAYVPKNQEDGFYERSDVKPHGIKGTSIGRGQINFKNNKWNKVKEEVILNRVGHHDGQVKVCNTVDGVQECYTVHNILMRNNATHYIRGMYFCTFFGGSDPGDAAPNDCHTYFRNIKISAPTEGFVIG